MFDDAVDVFVASESITFDDAGKIESVRAYKGAVSVYGKAYSENK